jgi:hypothetical protein
LTLVTIEANDTRLLKDLRLFVEPVEVYDPHGKILGVFVPANLERGKAMYAKLQTMVDRDREEIAKRGSDPRQCIPSEVVRTGLRALNEESERRKQAGEQPLSVEEAQAIMRGGLGHTSGPAAAASMPHPQKETEQCASR